MQVLVFNITTDENGDYEATKVVKTPAKLHMARWVDGDLVDGVDLVLTVTEFAPLDLETTLLDVDNANSDAVWYPRVTGDAADGTEIADAYAAPTVHGTLTCTVANGGDSKSGALRLYLQE